MTVEVTYPIYHTTKAEEIEGGYQFTCDICGYKRRQYLDGRKHDVLDKGDPMVGHLGGAGICELMDMAEQLKTAINDAACKCQLDNDGTKVPVSFG
jgi:hypothetical protein